MNETHEALGRDLVTAAVLRGSFRLRSGAQSSYYIDKYLFTTQPDLLRRLMLDSISTFCVLFRHALILHGGGASPRKRDVILAAKQQFAIDPTPFEKLLDIREERIKPREVDAVGLLDAYLQGIAVVIDAVDRLEK